jgi:electron transfer flavoprotein alpha subunit
MGSDLSALAEEWAAYPFDEIHVADHADLALYHPELYYSILSDLADRLQPESIWFGHTAIGRDLAPKLAAHLDAGQISDICAIRREEGRPVVFTRPIYAGKAFEHKSFTRTPWVVTVRPNNLPAAAPNDTGSRADIQAIAYTPAADLRTLVRDVVRKAGGKIDLAEARVVVSGGRGVKSAEGFQPLQELAEVLGAAVGASRGACDAGYCDYALQIGQTGKVVTPELYIACGISGAIQHLAGMSQSRVIIAINKDPEAPIFKVADYGIVGDLFEVVPVLTEELRKMKA